MDYRNVTWANQTEYILEEMPLESGSIFTSCAVMAQCNMVTYLWMMFLMQMYIHYRQVRTCHYFQNIMCKLMFVSSIN